MPETGIVLLVEDNPRMLHTNRRILEQEGCLILTAETLAQARQRLQIANPDVVVLDSMLPDGSGLDFLSELRSVSRAPVLFLAAKTNREDVIARLTAGGNDYLTKPYAIDEFRMRVQGFLRLAGRGRGSNGSAPKAAHPPDGLRSKLPAGHHFPLTTIAASISCGIFADELPPACLICRLNLLGNSGAAHRENELVQETMFNRHPLNPQPGSGAEHLLRGELCFLRGDFTDAIISLHRTLHEAPRSGQTSLFFAADFLRLRIATFQGNYGSVEDSLQAMRAAADQQSRYPLQHTADICAAWIYALCQQPHKAAPWIAAGDLHKARIMFPGVPFLHLVYCQLLLAQGAYAALIAREEEERALYRIYPTLLGEIYLDLQLASAYEQLGKRGTALRHLTRALEAAAPDGLLLPFVENSRYLDGPLRELPQDLWGHELEVIRALSLQNHLQQSTAPCSPNLAAISAELSERELSVAQLAASGLSNKEIAARVYLSESRVKSYLSSIFKKLGITHLKNKRRLLINFFGPGN